MSVTPKNTKPATNVCLVAPCNKKLQYYLSRVGGVNMCPGQPYFLVPQDEDIITNATMAIKGNTRLSFENSCILIFDYE